jgi:hypothetical protein
MNKMSMLPQAKTVTGILLFPANKLLDHFEVTL